MSPRESVVSWLSAHGNVSCFVIHWLAARHCSDHSRNRFWELNQLWETWEGWRSCLRGHRCTLLSEARVRELPAVSVALLPNCEISYCVRHADDVVEPHGRRTSSAGSDPRGLACHTRMRDGTLECVTCPVRGLTSANGFI